MIAMVCTRPDLAYAMSLVSILMSTPRKKHCHAVKWILRYVKVTTERGLLYSEANETENVAVG